MNAQQQQLRWDDVMELAASSVDTLADHFVARASMVTGYRSGEVSIADMRDTARQAFTKIIESLKQGSPTEDLVAFAAEIGSSRARAGVPVGALALAARFDFRVLWDHLLEICGPNDSVLLVTRVNLVWDIVDHYITVLNENYASEQARLARDERAFRREYISRLFGRGGSSPDVIREVASALRLDLDESYTLVAVTESLADQLHSTVAASPLKRSIFVFDRDAMTFAFWQSTRRGYANETVEIQPQPTLDGLIGGLVVGIAGVTELVAAADLAGALARVARSDDGGPLTPDRGWSRVVHEKLREAGLNLVAEADRRLLEVRDQERERIEETVREFLKNGSISETASVLYCHRNTILNRLKRFHEVTGLDLTVPADSARLVISWL